MSGFQLSLEAKGGSKLSTQNSELVTNINMFVE